MERTERALQIQAEALAGGISEKRLENDIKATYLPENGTFTGYEIAYPNTRSAHIRLTCEDGSSISVGTLKALAFNGNMENASFRKVENPESVINGGFVLTGTTAINPHLSGKMADLADRLIGRSFIAKPVERITLSVKTDKDGNVLPYKTENEARKSLVVKKFYEVELK